MTTPPNYAVREQYTLCFTSQHSLFDRIRDSYNYTITATLLNYQEITVCSLIICIIEKMIHNHNNDGGNWNLYTFETGRRKILC